MNTSSVSEGCLTSVITIIVALCVGFVLALLFTWPEMLLWNALITKFFGLQTITFWEMFGLNIFLTLCLPKPSVSSGK